MEGLNLTFFFLSLLLNFQDLYILLTVKKLYVENLSEKLSFFLFVCLFYFVLMYVYKQVASYFLV